MASEDYEVLLAVIDCGSLTAAARKLGKSLQATSRVLAALERELGVQLVARTTRKSVPTTAGLAFANRIRGALADIQFAREELADAGERVGGLIRVGASTLFGPRYVLPALAAAAERHAGLEIELALSDQHTDLISDGIDTETWTLREDDAAIPVAVRGRFRSNNATARNEAAALGAGITLAPHWQVRPLLDEGRLDLVLTEYEPEPIPLHLNWPASPRLPRRTRVLADLLASRLREAVMPAP